MYQDVIYTPDDRWWAQTQKIIDQKKIDLRYLSNVCAQNAQDFIFDPSAEDHLISVANTLYDSLMKSFDIIDDELERAGKNKINPEKFALNREQSADIIAFYDFNRNLMTELLRVITDAYSSPFENEREIRSVESLDEDEYNNLSFLSRLMKECAIYESEHEDPVRQALKWQRDYNEREYEAMINLQENMHRFDVDHFSSIVRKGGHLPHLDFITARF